MRISYLRKAQVGRILKAALFLTLLWTTIETITVRHALQANTTTEIAELPPQKIFIVSIHWTDEHILRMHWSQALLDLTKYLGKDNVYVSIYESGSLDNSKGALRELDRGLEEAGVRRSVVLDETPRSDVVNAPSTDNGWIQTPRGMKELRRIPYLAELRNKAMQPLLELERSGERFDKVLWLNDVIFNTDDVRKLLATRNGDYAAACSMDFKTPPYFYDTFALRDSAGHAALMATWPYFRGEESRRAVKSGLPVPVSSCWNGMVVMDATPFYDSTNPLTFRGLPDSLADQHLEGSECCLIHADNPLSQLKGVFLNPEVRVGYLPSAYQAMNPGSQEHWLSTWDIVRGVWANRIKRWLTTDILTESTVSRRLSNWIQSNKEHAEGGRFCLINEMQVLVGNGWAHV